MIQSEKLHIKTKENIQYATFPHFNATELVHHGFSTKHGGVSQGCYGSMNLSFSRGDEAASVQENFRRFSQAIGTTPESLVFSHQVHKTKIHQVIPSDRGKGFSHPTDIEAVDGLVTNAPGVTLTTFYADCVPLFFLDPEKKAIGLSHAGWRGTVGGIGPKTVTAMKELFGTKAEALLVGIGPSIGPCCYEVSEDVIMEFEKNTKHGIMAKIVQPKDDNHWMLNLWEANRQYLLDAGVQPQNIITTDLCTRCHSEDFFSHRVMGTKRGSLAAMLALRATE